MKRVNIYMTYTYHLYGEPSIIQDYGAGSREKSEYLADLKHGSTSVHSIHNQMIHLLNDCSVSNRIRLGIHHYDIQWGI